jgi:tetratricopeptide (TPR) repeat protein
MDEHLPSPGGRPAVGNVLGFSLLLRDRQALLRLERRALHPGVRLLDYEAEVPDVEFPLRAHGAAVFRRRRCRARQLRLEIDAHAITAWVSARLHGQELEGLRVDEVALELAGAIEPGATTSPCLLLGGEHHGRRAWLLLALQVLPHGRKLALRPWRAWRAGEAAPEPEALWRSVTTRLHGATDPELPDAVVLDPARHALLRPFVEAGWRAPALDGLVLQGLALAADQVELSFGRRGESAEAQAWPREPAREPEPVGERLARIHGALQAGERAVACTELERLADALPPEHLLRLPALRWLAQLARHHDPALALRALQAWLHLRPRDAAAACALVIALGRAGNHAVLAKRLAGECRLPNPPRRQALLELALACTLVDRLDDVEAGEGLLEPLLRRCAQDPGLRELELPVRAAVARARAAGTSAAATPAAALDALDHALALTDRSATRASVQAGVAAALARRGHHREAAPLWREIVRTAPDDGELVDEALASVRAAGDQGLAIELLRVAIPHAAPAATLALRRALVTTLRERGDPTSRELARVELRSLVREHPESRELALELSGLERHDGRPDAAASLLGKLAETSDDAEDRARLRLEQARLLAEGGEPRRAWANLQPVLEAAPPALEAELLELAIGIAPLSVRDRLIDRLAEIDDGPRSGRALLARARVRRSGDQRRADLEAATQRLEDPRPALRELAELAPADDPEPWATLADACATHGDAVGEAAARVELALRHLRHEALEAAAEALDRARPLRPRDAALTVAHGWVLARAGRFADAAELLATVSGRLPLEAAPLSDPRLGLPTQPDRARGHIGVVLLRAGRPAEAAMQLRPAIAALGATAEAKLAEALIEALEALGEHREASVIARGLADGQGGATRARWLAAAARHAEPRDAVQWLREAVELAPDDPELVAALERAARAARDDTHVGLALQRAAQLPALPPAERARALRELLTRRRRAGIEPADDPELVTLYEQLLALDGDDVGALLVLGTCARRDGDDARARALWARALEHLPAGDPRRLEPSVMLAGHELAQGEPEAARERLSSVLGQRGVPREAYEILAEAARLLGDATTRLRALRGIIAHAKDGPVRLDAELQLARQLGEIGRSREGLGHAAAATRGSSRGSAEHIDSARVWLTLATTVDDPRQEAAARIELRRGLGSELSAKELRAEALLLAERLADPEGARQVIEEGLVTRPTDELLLSTLKHLAQTLGALEPYLVALDAAVEGMVPGPDRDRLASELASSAAEVGDATRAHRALERLSLQAGDGEELLDLRDWAVRSLGLEAQELRRIDLRLRTEAPSAGLLQRLARLVGEGEPLVEHLLGLARDADPETARRLVEPALALAEPLAMPSLSILVLRLALRVQAVAATEAAWSGLLARVSAEGDDATLADLVALADDARKAGVAVDEQIDRQLDEALARHPASPHLHRALARHLTQRDGTQQVEHVAHLEAIADRYELAGLQRAELFVGMAEPLDRRAAAELLAARAERALDDPAVFGRLVRALEARQCWPEVLRLLRARVAASTSVDEQVVSWKHLAHVTSEVLGDPTAAVGHLEAALVLAPTDPDLLLPLLDHHFSQTDLQRAVELTERVLEHVRMGDAAFAALAHRAADAAIAQGEPERAKALLERITRRIPDDAKARARMIELQELRERVDEPARRVALLAAVATRQSGQARIEALEERARLLLEALHRPHEAMEDLAAVVADAPDRQASVELLATLYREHGRWTELVELREAELPRRHGLARARLLVEIAQLQRDGLHELPRAEQALRLALEQLGTEQLGTDDDERALADELREALADNLERQGRVVDLAGWLEQELATELDPPERHPRPPPPRLALLQRLARLARERLDDEARAARIYEHLERWRALPDEGLATLARWYRRSGRYEALVRVLRLRALALAEHSERRAVVDLHIAELLDGPLARPHDAAPYYLDAFLADPEAHPAAGARARVLLGAIDSVINVRDRLLRRLHDIGRARRPALLTLLADVLAPHEAHEDEAEARYREAIALDDDLAAAHEGLGRLLGRRGRKDEAARALVAATERPGLPPARAADAAALAARHLIELQRLDEAEAVLRRALSSQPDSARALLELARLYERSGRSNELTVVLDQLAQLPLPGAMLAEVAYRRALLLQPIYDVVPHGPQGERARSHLLEALGANPRHAAARQALQALATARREWSIVAHMHYLAIRELPPGASRASVHLQLAATYLDHLGDAESAMRNIESALQQAPTDGVVTYQTGELARRMPDPAAAADRFETIAAADNELDDAARARLWLLAAELRMEDDDRDAAEAASRRVLELPAAPEDATAAATRTLERIHPRDLASLAEAGVGLLAQLDEQPPLPLQARVQLLAKLHDIGVALDDADLMQRASREQVELAEDLDESDAEASTTGVLLRDLLAARGEYGPVVQLYERLASRAGGDDPARAAAVLVEAAGYAWRGQKQPAQAASLLGRALELAPDHEAAMLMLGELAHETTDPVTAGALQRALGAAPAGPPALRLRLAMLAATRGDEEQALALLRPLTEPDVPEDTRLEALARLEALLSERGEPQERRRVLEAWLSLALPRHDARTGDLGLELARLQHAEGDRAAARRTCEAARRVAPEHRELLHLLAELTEQDEDWPRTAVLLEELAGLSVEDDEQAGWLTEAAAVYLQRPALPAGGDGSQVARRLLLRAAELAPRSPEPRVALLPLAFSQARWDEVLELAEAIVAQTGHDEDALGPAALVEAYRRGERKLAREIGFRHSAEVARRVLLPALQQLLAEVAMRGPLPRLDALLAAGSSLLGGRRLLFESLLGWASEQPPDPGLALGLARLFEARGAGELARHHYQLAAFMAPRGPVPALVARLPAGWLRDPDLHRVSTAPMEGRSALREVLAALRDHLTGIGTHGAPEPAPPHARVPSWWPARMELAETIVEPWRAILGVDLPLAWTEDPLPSGVAVRNDQPPRILLGRACTSQSLPELTFRLARATAGVALGLTVLEAGEVDLGGLLDALGQLANPAHQPTGAQALALADTLAARDARNIGLTVSQRAGLLDELAHWLTTPGGLPRLHGMLRRSRLLLATRLGTQLDGALLAIARDHGFLQEGRVDAAAALRVDDATWLLRALSLR